MQVTHNNISKEVNFWLSNNSYTSIFLLVDENTKKYCINILALEHEFNIIEIKSGEKNKNLDTCKKIWTSLLKKNADRNSILINLGGGVICDMGAFCAATYKRGIHFINIPTTLLSQVDASVGAKTGVDFLGQKNMIGLFVEAQEVFIDSAFLKTLEKRELLSGFAEVLKHGLIYDEKYFELCITNFSSNCINWDYIVEKSILIKTEVVKKDPKEKGLRKILNFGHTIGHALESYSLKYHKKHLLHGEAIILGIIAELQLSKNKYQFKNIETIVAKLLEIYKYKELENFNFDKVISYTLNDKKNTSGVTKCVLLREIGEAVYNITINENDILEALNFMTKKIDENIYK